MAAADGGAPLPLPPEPEIACTFDLANASLEVSLGPSGPPYAILDATDDATDLLSIPTGDARRGAKLVHAAHGIHIRTFVEAARLDLHVKKAVAFGGWYVPYASSALRWTSGADGRLALEPVTEPAIGDSVELAIVEPPRATLPCEAISVRVPEAFDALADESSDESYVRADEAIPLSRAPGGPAVATVRFRHADEASVAVFERRERSVRVAITGFEAATLIGWIPAAALAPQPRMGGHRVQAPSVRFGKAERHDARTVSCAEPVPIDAEAKGQRGRIGEIEADTTFVFYAGAGDEREVKLRGVRPLEGARLLVPARVEGCK